MAAKVMKAVILGAPASGKGTISARIVKHFNFKHISSGDQLRLHIQQHTDLGKEAKKYVETGWLVPDSLMINMITAEVAKVAQQNWLLDGFPRSMPQAEELWKKTPFDIALNLAVPFEVIINRVKGRWIHLPSGRVYNVDFNAPKIAGKDDITGEDLVQREDDSPEVVQRRLQAYSEMVGPIVEFYKSQGILHTFSGSTSDEIWPQVAGQLQSALSDSVKYAKM